MVREHVLGIKLLNYQDIMLIDQFARELMNEIMPTILDTFVDTRDDLSIFSSGRSTIGLSGEFALSLRKGLFFGLEESRVGDKRTIREGGKLLKSNVNTDHLAGRRKRFGLDLTDKTDKPFAVLPTNSASFDLAFDGSMKFDLDDSDLGQLDIAIEYGPTGLRIGERIVPIPAPVSWITRLLSRLHPAKERLEREVYPYCNVLKNLTMHSLKISPCLSENLKPPGLNVVVKRYAASLVLLLSVREHPVIRTTTAIQCLLQRANLSLVWV